MVASLDEERNRLLWRISFVLCVILVFVFWVAIDVSDILNLLKELNQ